MGTFYVSLKHDDNWIQYISKGEIPPWWKKVSDNKLVRGGAAWLEDKACGNTNTNWTTLVISHMAIGIEDATNFGTEGPSTGAKPKTGAWQGPSSLDFRLSLEVARSPVNYTRLGDTLIFNAIFSDADIQDYLGGTATEIRELGLFLSNTPPTDNPFDSEDEQDNAMIVRSVRFSETITDYVDDPLVKEADGENLELFYQMRLA